MRWGAEYAILRAIVYARGDRPVVSQYLKQNRSIEELVALIEQDREATLSTTQIAFRSEVSTAITNISEISQIANAKILADSQVASAKLMTNAEVMAVHLMAKAEMAVLDIQQQAQSGLPNTQMRRDMIAEINRNTAAIISTTAKDTILDIQREAQEAIDRLKSIAAHSIEEIQELASEVAARAAQNDEAAKAELSKAMQRLHPADDVAMRARLGIEKVRREALRASQELREVADKAIKLLNDTVEEATHAISMALVASENRIIVAKNSALGRIDEIVARMAPSSPS
jgi:hypothetical protein